MQRLEQIPPCELGRANGQILANVSTSFPGKSYHLPGKEATTKEAIMTAEDIKSELDRLYPDAGVITKEQGRLYMNWGEKMADAKFQKIREHWTQNHPIKVFKSDFAESVATERTGRRNG